MSLVYIFNTNYGSGEIYYTLEYIEKFIFHFEKFLEKSRHSNIPVYIKNFEEDVKNYFNGEKIDFIKYPINLKNFTKFEKDIIITLRKIKYGTVISYKELGNLAGYKDASRAVGNLMKKNPFPIIVPCHRVIKANGDIGRYTPGEKYKEFLLSLETENS